MSGVEVQNITKRFGRALALDDVTVSFPDGGFFGRQ